MPHAIDTGDTAWILVSSALVLLMFPGLALFYGGLVRTKNVLSTFMHTFVALGLITLQWTILGYSLSFGTSVGGFIGNLDFALLRGVGLEPSAGMTIPHLLFVVYQLVFAAITPALISGAYAERMKFSGFALFTVLWATLIYDPVAHWMWGNGGWLKELGALDFAGGIVVHVSSGLSALVAALVVGKRRGWPKEKMLPHNLTMTMLGAGLLWVGWFGFNGGSALGANGQAVLAVANSQLAASAGALVWIAIDLKRFGRASALGFASGFVAGLATVTPASGYVSPMAAVVIGAAAGTVCYGGILLKERFSYDDTLDAFGVHGVGGILGSLLLGVFATKLLNPSGADGALHGNVRFLGVQALAVGVTVAWSLVGTWALLKLVDKVVGLRVTSYHEGEGLDVNLHGEPGYAFGAASHGHSMREDEELDVSQSMSATG